MPFIPLLPRRPSQISGLPCGKADAACLDPGGALWPDSYLNPDTGRPLHCFDCGVACVNGSAGGGGQNGTGSDFCNRCVPSVWEIKKNMVWFHGSVRCCWRSLTRFCRDSPLTHSLSLLITPPVTQAA